jgi:hypothetical protein
VLETEQRRKETNRKRLDCVQPNSNSGQVHRTVRWCTGLSGGAPDSVRCARLVSNESAALRNRRRRTAKNHRTVRWCTGLSDEPTVASANGRPRNLCATRGRANGRQGAPDCLVCTGQCPMRQRTRSCNGQLCPIWKAIEHQTGYSSCPVAHQTVRCATRQKARMTFQVCLQWLLAALGL